MSDAQSKALAKQHVELAAELKRTRAERDRLREALRDLTTEADRALRTYIGPRSRRIFDNPDFYPHEGTLMQATDYAKSLLRDEALGEA